MQLTKNFSRSEFSCKCGCGFNTVDYQLLNILQYLRDKYDQPVTITSACRCSAHNKRIGGSKKSQHLIGRAADIIIKDISLKDIYEHLDKKYPNTLGLGIDSSFVHIDTRDAKARWTY